MKIIGWILLAMLLVTGSVFAQNGRISGTVRESGEPLGYANIGIAGTTKGTVANDSGYFELTSLSAGNYTLVVSAVGYEKLYRHVVLKPGQQLQLTLEPERSQHALNEVTVTGTMKEAGKLSTPVPVEIYTPKFFRKNISNNLFESLGMINGVQPTMNCNVCNTGDIHINGMEGPYTLILIDGMPIVSSLSTVYGMMGIPNGMVERIEVVKGPASTLYGSEAVAGIVNVITKTPAKAPRFSFEVFGTTYNELNTDMAMKWKTSKADILLSANYFLLNTPWDKNKDGFTDITLQNRISLFNKISLRRPKQREANLGIRLFYEDRWGGQTNWNKSFRGGDSVYGESIYTKRLEVIGNYQLPTMQLFKLMYSYNIHHQNSYYGTIPYMASQQVAFTQLVHQHRLGKRHDFLAGAGVRFTHYDDNTPATASVSGQNSPSVVFLPGLFLQDEISLSSTQTLLLGARYDYYREHGSIFSPRINYKIQPNPYNTIRLSAGNGFRIVNLFTEDHAALTGAREVVVQNKLLPEKSWNVNINYMRFVSIGKGFVSIDATAFYTYFTNRIIADYDSDPNKIIYNNLHGYAISRGISLNTDISFSKPLKINLGATLMDVYKVEDDSTGKKVKSIQVHAPNFSANVQISYTINRLNLTIDYTAQIYSPMRLPVLPNDFRPEYSPWFTIQNLQFTKKIKSNWQVYLGIKNLLNFMPKDPIMRAFDPFDKQTSINNPNGYTFDPSYNYAPLLSRRVLFGVRYQLF